MRKLDQTLPMSLSSVCPGVPTQSCRKDFFGCFTWLRSIIPNGMAKIHQDSVVENLGMMLATSRGFFFGMMLETCRSLLSFLPLLPLENEFVKPLGVIEPCPGGWVAETGGLHTPDFGPFESTSKVFCKIPKQFLKQVKNSSGPPK